MMIMMSMIQTGMIINYFKSFIKKQILTIKYQI